MATKLTPEMIAQILAGTLSGWGVSGGDTGNYVGSPESGGTWQASPQGFYQDLPDGMRTAYDAQGNPIEENYKVGESVFNPGEIAAFIAAAYGLNALGGAMGAGAGAAGGAAASGSAPVSFGSESMLGATNPYGMTGGALESAAADAIASGGLQGSFGAEGLGGLLGGNAFSAMPELGSSLGSTGLNALRAGEIANYATNGKMPTPAVPAGTGLLGGLGGLGDLAKIGAPLLGAVAGAKGGPDQVSGSKTDPRLDPYLYGDKGILKSAADWYGANKTGSNPIMQQGWDMQKGLINNPQVQQQLAGLLSNAYGMYQSPVAGNPWKKG